MEVVHLRSPENNTETRRNGLKKKQSLFAGISTQECATWKPRTKSSVKKKRHIEIIERHLNRQLKNVNTWRDLRTISESPKIKSSGVISSSRENVSSGGHLPCQMGPSNGEARKCGSLPLLCLDLHSGESDLQKKREEWDVSVLEEELPVEPLNATVLSGDLILKPPPDEDTESEKPLTEVERNLPSQVAIRASPRVAPTVGPPHVRLNRVHPLQMCVAVLAFCFLSYVFVPIFF